MKVFVNGWTYEGGGGFNWYLSEQDRDAAHVEELKNEAGFAEAQWKAYSFDADVFSLDNANAEIDAIFDSMS